MNKKITKKETLFVTRPPICKLASFILILIFMKRKHWNKTGFVIAVGIINTIMSM